MILQHNSAEEALRPIFDRWQEQDTDRPLVLRAQLDNWGEEAFWKVVPPSLKARVMAQLEKTGWQRPALKPLPTDLERAIAWFKSPAWRRLPIDQKAFVIKEFA